MQPWNAETAYTTATYVGATCHYSKNDMRRYKFIGQIFAISAQQVAGAIHEEQNVQNGILGNLVRTSATLLESTLSGSTSWLCQQSLNLHIATGKA